MTGGLASHVPAVKGVEGAVRKTGTARPQKRRFHLPAWSCIVVAERPPCAWGRLGVPFMAARQGRS